MSEYQPSEHEVAVSDNDTPVSIHRALKDAGSDIELAILKELIAGFFGGQKWLLDRTIGMDINLGLKFRSFGPKTENMPSCCFRDRGIELNTESLKLLKKGQTVDTVFRTFWGISPPQGQQLSVRQIYECIGVHETVHYLQQNGCPGFIKNPMDGNDYVPPTADLLTYWRSPREAEAIRYEGQFFQERYGNNPFLKIEQASTFQ